MGDDFVAILYHKRYTILSLSIISLTSLVGIVLAIIYKNYYNIFITGILPFIGIYIFKSKLFKVEEEKNLKFIKKAYLLNFIFIIFCSFILLISNFKNTILESFICLVILSIAYTIIYGLVHEHLIKISKKYVFVYLMLTLIIMISLIMVFANIPKEYFAYRLSESTTAYDLIPYGIGAKFIIDVLLSLGIFPSLAW